MSRTAYLIEIQPGDIASIAFAAGVLTAQGVPQGQVIGNMLDNIQMVEVPEELFGDEGLPEGADPNLTAEDIPEADPVEVQRILDEMPPPPQQPVYYPQNRQEDFGAGPPPRG